MFKRVREKLRPQNLTDHYSSEYLEWTAASSSLRVQTSDLAKESAAMLADGRRFLQSAATLHKTLLALGRSNDAISPEFVSFFETSQGTPRVCAAGARRALHQALSPPLTVLAAR
jgi:hypothetical protein